MVQLGFFFHMKMAMGAPTVALTRPLIFAITFMLFFSIVIALFKDIPDVKGDAQVQPHPLLHTPIKTSLFLYSSSEQVRRGPYSLCGLQEGVRTLSVRAGVKTVFWTCIVLLEIAYAGAIGVGLMSEVPSNCPFSSLILLMQS